MNRSQPVFSSFRARVALFVTLLQVVGALHFALVPHAYSAQLGGVVHVHGAARSAQPQRALLRAAPVTALAGDSASCLAERCPVADAPQSSPPCFELLAAGSVEFGGARLLREQSAQLPESLRLFSRAPKTSPPV